MINKLKICACDPVIPIVYDDSLSYYEAINKTVNKVNECVEVVNQLTNAVANISTTIDDIQSRLGTAESTITEHSLKLISLQSSVDELVESVNNLKNTVDTHATDIANLKTNYSELAGRVTNVESSVSTLSNTVATQGTKLTTVESDVNVLKGRQHVEIYTDDDSGNYYADVTEPDGDTNQYNIAGTDNLNRVKSDLTTLSNTVSAQGTKITNVETNVDELRDSVNSLDTFKANFTFSEVPTNQITTGLSYSGITETKAYYVRLGKVIIVNAIVKGISNLVANETIISFPFKYSPNVKVAVCNFTNTTSINNNEPYDVDNIIYASVENNRLIFRASKASGSPNNAYTFSCILY